MKRREFITSLAVLGCTAIVPLPKDPIPTASVYKPLIENDSTVYLTPEMLDGAFEYFGKMVVEHIRVYSERDKRIMDLLKWDGEKWKRK